MKKVNPNLLAAASALPPALLLFSFLGYGLELGNEGAAYYYISRYTGLGLLHVRWITFLIYFSIAAFVNREYVRAHGLRYGEPPPWEVSAAIYLLPFLNYVYPPTFWAASMLYVAVAAIAIFQLRKRIFVPHLQRRSGLIALPIAMAIVAFTIVFVYQVPARRADYKISDLPGLKGHWLEPDVNRLFIQVRGFIEGIGFERDKDALLTYGDAAAIPAVLSVRAYGPPSFIDGVTVAQNCERFEAEREKFERVYVVEMVSIPSELKACFSRRIEPIGELQSYAIPIRDPKTGNGLNVKVLGPFRVKD